jgi:hypothetical protein
MKQKMLRKCYYDVAEGVTSLQSTYKKYTRRQLKFLILDKKRMFLPHVHEDLHLYTRKYIYVRQLYFYA